MEDGTIGSAPELDLHPSCMWHDGGKTKADV